MTKELSKKELLKLINTWEMKGSHGIEIKCDYCKEAYQQLRKLIEGKPKVSKEFVNSKAFLMRAENNFTKTRYRIKEMLQEAGVEVEE